VTVPTLRLNSGIVIPKLGFGVFKVPPDEVFKPVLVALEAGYRLIDTAAVYRNEQGVGRAIAASGIPRDELFITTKVWNSHHGHDRTLDAFEHSLQRLGLEVVDLYLIHWPVPRQDRYVETWRALEKIRASGRARAIGVSNFQRSHLDRLITETGVVPAVNQVELHPWFPQDELRTYHAEHDIRTQAWAPLGQGKGLLDDPVVVALGQAKDRTPAQIVLRWHIQLGNMVIPKSVAPERIR
jgi:2,5-diketo-D-gluconate reductase A